MTDTTTIDPVDAAELYELEDGEYHGEWKRLAAQPRSTTRWLEHFWLVICPRGGGSTYGIPYAHGLTEMQDSDLPWERSDGPIQLTPLVGVPVTSTKYLTEDQYKAHLQTRSETR